MLVLNAVGALHDLELATGHACRNSLLCELQQRFEALVVLRAQALIRVVCGGQDDERYVRQLGGIDLMRGLLELHALGVRRPTRGVGGACVSGDGADVGEQRRRRGIEQHQSDDVVRKCLPA